MTLTLSVAAFARVPGIGPLRTIERPPHSGGRTPAGSSEHSSSRILDRDERCFVTKTISYNHEQAHWVNAVRSDRDRSEEVEKLLQRLGIVSQNDFCLDDPSNLANLDRAVHKSLDVYAFIAFTCDASTLDQLIEIIKVDNDHRQRVMDGTGMEQARRFNFSADCFRYPKYELVALHPEHFLPSGSTLTIYDPALDTHKTYVPCLTDRTLRALPGNIDSSPLPSFFFEPQRGLNPFLVILNAEIKFRRYLRQIEMENADHALPPQVRNLIQKTMDLVRLLYWTPVATAGSYGEQMVTARIASRRRNEVRAGRPSSTAFSECDGEMGFGIDEDMATFRARGGGGRGGHRYPLDIFEDPDPQVRMMLGSYLMSGHDLSCDSDDDQLLEDLHGRHNQISAVMTTLVS